MLNRVIREIDRWIILGSELIDGADVCTYMAHLMQRLCRYN